MIFQYFNSLPHTEVDTRCQYPGIPRNQFQLTTSHRGRQCIRTAYTGNLISTHYLTQRQTVSLWHPTAKCVISTHYLTQRQTNSCNRRLFRRIHISTHYLTQRQTILRDNCLCNHVISTHYLTQRQTQLTLVSSTVLVYFNSLPHTEVDPYPPLQGRYQQSFQLTTSHRGRPVRQHIEDIINSNFNSLPHTEVDLWSQQCSHLQQISTHYLTQRQT